MASNVERPSPTSNDHAGPLEPPSSLRGSQQMIQEIKSMLTPTAHESSLFASLSTILFDFLRKRFPGQKFRLVPYGSVVTGLAIPGTSDADFTIIFEGDMGRLTRAQSTKRLEMLAPAIRQIADPGSFRFIRTAKVPVVKFTMARVEVDFTANSMEAEEASGFIKKTIDESPAFKDAVLLLKHFLTPKGLMVSCQGGISSFILSLVVRFCFQRAVKDFKAAQLTGRMFIDLLYCLTTFDFAKWVIRVDGEPVLRSESQTGAIFILPFLGKGPHTGNVAAPLSSVYWEQIRSAGRQLFLGLSSSISRGATLSELMSPSTTMIQGRQNLADITSASFQECLQKQRDVGSPTTAAPTQKREKRRADNDDTEGPSAKRARYGPTPQTAHSSPSRAASSSKTPPLTPADRVALTLAKTDPMHSPRQVVLSPGISAVIYSSPPPATLRTTPVEAKAPDTTPFKTDVVCVSNNRVVAKETLSRDVVAAPLPSSADRKVVAARSSSDAVVLPVELVMENDGGQDGLVGVREKQVLREHSRGNPSRASNLNSVVGRVGAVEAREVKQTAPPPLGSSVVSFASAWGLHCTIQ